MPDNTRELNENTVIGTAKTRVDGKLVYVDILYGNRVVSRDGALSRIDPAVYDRILAAYLEQKETEYVKTEEPETEKEVPDTEYFHSEDEYVLKEETESETCSLHEDKGSFFYSGIDAENTEGGEMEAATESDDEAALSADSPDDDELVDNPKGKRNTAIIAMIVTSVILLLLLAAKILR